MLSRKNIYEKTRTEYDVIPIATFLWGLPLSELTLKYIYGMIDENDKVFITTPKDKQEEPLDKNFVVILVDNENNIVFIEREIKIPCKENEKIDDIKQKILILMQEKAINNSILEQEKLDEQKTIN